MAFDGSREVQRELMLLAKNDKGDYYRIARVIPTNGKGQESIDIRLMYTPDGSDEPSFTKKGLRINSEHAAEVVKNMLIALNSEEIEELKELLEEENCKELVEALK